MAKGAARTWVLASDLHLGEAVPRTCEAFCTWLRDTSRACDALLLLGDVFEVWLGDDWLEHAPPAWLCDVCAAMREASGFTRLGVMRGNRDFLLGEGFARRTGATLLPDVWVLQGAHQRIVLCHGDTLVTQDVDYQRWRRTTRELAWQTAFLARPLSERQQLAAHYRDASKAHQQAQPRDTPYHDVDETAAETLRAQHGATWLIHGHTHRPREHWRSSPTPSLRQVLSDWEMDAPAAAPRGDALWLHSHSVDNSLPERSLDEAWTTLLPGPLSVVRRPVWRGA